MTPVLSLVIEPPVEHLDNFSECSAGNVSIRCGNTFEMDQRAELDQLGEGEHGNVPHLL